MNQKTIMLSQNLWNLPSAPVGPGDRFVTIRTRTPDSPVDLLAVSAYLFRRYRDDINRFTDLFQTANHSQIEEQDHQRANEIADYYSKQIVMAHLRGDEITDWQRAVAKFINGDRRRLDDHSSITGTGVGLVYRLPEYYENDIVMRKFFDEHFHEHNYVEMYGPHEMFGHPDSRGVFAIIKLQPLTTVDNHTRNEKVTQYWLKDVENDNPVMLKIDSKNQLKYLWERFFNGGDPIEVEGNFTDHTHSLGVKYAHSRNWKLKL